MQNNGSLETPASRYYLGMDTKPCISCGVELPATSKHFAVREGQLRNVCRICKAKMKKAEQERKKERTAKELTRVEQRGMDIYARLAATGGTNVPHSADVVEKIIEYFGGTSGFAAMLVKQFYDSPAGSSVRNKLLETVCRLVQSNVDSGGAKKPLSLWTEEELEQELNDRFRAALLEKHSLVYDEEKTPRRLPANDTDAALDNSSPEDGDEESPERAEGEAAGGAEAIPTDPPAASDP